MAAYLLIAAGAGLASIALSLVFAFGYIEGMPLVLISPLPLFLVGLSMGAPAALIAGGVASLIGAVFQPGLGINFLLCFAIPGAILCRQALLWRADAAGNAVWYPLGRLATVLAGIAAVYMLVAFALAALLSDGLPAMTERALAFQATLMQLPPEHQDSFVAQAPIILAMAPAMSMMLLIFNGALAQRLLQQFGRNIRPKADIVDLQLPRPLLVAMLVAMAAAFLPGTIGIIGKTLAAIGAVTYFLAGLGVIHAWVRNWSARGIVLPLAYVAVFLIFWLTLAVIGLGLWSQIKGLRGSGSDRQEE